MPCVLHHCLPEASARTLACLPWTWAAVPQADDEYMITDNDPLLTRYMSVPRSYGAFNPGALIAGVVRGILDTAGFPAM